MGRVSEWRVHGPPWQRGIVSGVVFGAGVVAFGLAQQPRSVAWSLALGMAGAVCFGGVMWFHLRRHPHIKPVTSRAYWLLAVGWMAMGIVYLARGRGVGLRVIGGVLLVVGIVWLVRAVSVGRSAHSGRRSSTT